MSHHLFSDDSPWRDVHGWASWPYSISHSPQCHCPEMGEYREGQLRERWRTEIAAERERQKSLGYGAEHDKEHGVDHLLVWAQEYSRRGKALENAALIEAARELMAAQADALAVIARSLYNRNISWWETYDEIEGVLRSVGHHPPVPVAGTGSENW